MSRDSLDPMSIRTSSSEARLIRHAAHLAGVSYSTLIRAGALATAHRVLEHRDVLMRTGRILDDAIEEGSREAAGLVLAGAEG